MSNTFSRRHFLQYGMAAIAGGTALGGLPVHAAQAPAGTAASQNDLVKGYCPFCQVRCTYHARVRNGKILELIGDRGNRSGHRRRRQRGGAVHLGHFLL